MFDSRFNVNAQGPNVTPLMLLMLTRLCCRKQSSDALTNRFVIYESFVEMLLERSIDKFSKQNVDSVLPSWTMNSDKTMNSDFKQWLIDMLSLIGAMMHMIGDDRESGGAAVRKYDVALALEMTFEDAKSRGVSIQPPGCPPDVDWIDELDRIYQQQLSNESSSSPRKTAVKYEGMMMWVLSTVFGLVSIQPRKSDFRCLEFVLFAHILSNSFRCGRIWNVGRSNDVWTSIVSRVLDGASVVEASKSI